MDNLILADSQGREIKSLLNVGVDIDLNGERNFEISVHRSAWSSDFQYNGYIFQPNTEIGGMIGRVYTDTALEVVKVCGLTWRGMLSRKIIEPPSGQSYRVVSGEMNQILAEMIEPEFDGLFVVSEIDTGVTVTNYQFERYVDLHDGLSDMMQEYGFRFQIAYREETQGIGYVEIQAVPVTDFSAEIELSQDSGLDFQLNDIRNGYNHMIVAGKGELTDRNVFHLYAWPNGVIKDTPYYTGLNERTYLYENTSTETEEVRTKAKEEFKKIMDRQEFGMNTAAMDLDVNIGDILGGRDYLTGVYMAKPVSNIIYTTDEEGEINIEYQLEGEN